MKKIICLFALLFVSLFASANNNESNASTLVNFTETVTPNAEANPSITVTSFAILDGLKVCYTTTLTLLVDTYVSPVTGQTMEVYRVYTSTVCMTV